MTDKLFFIAGLVLLGVTMGSFIGALVWRLKKQQDIEEAIASAGKNPVKKVANKLKGIKAHDERYSIVKGRSMCSHCEHPLAPTDLIPVVSWLWLRGRCRYCKQPIGLQEILLEFAMPILFVVSYLCWPTALLTWSQWTAFAIWLAYLVLLAALFVYDLRWYILPDKLVWPLVGLAVINAIVQITAGGTFNDVHETIQYYLYGLVPIAGLYWLIYFFSKGRMVGLGDVKLGIFIGLALGWQKSMIVLLLSNVVGGLIVLPLLMARRIRRDTRIPFGPLLIAAFFVAGLWGDHLLLWYLMIHLAE